MRDLTPKDLADIEGLNQELLLMCIAATVPLIINDFEQYGGPTKYDYRLAESYVDIIASGSDVIIRRSKKRGEVASMFNILCRSLAILAFCPGGSRFMDMKFEGKVAETK